MRIWLILGTVGVLGGGTALFTKLSGSGGEGTCFNAAVETGPIVMTVETLGTIEPLTTVTVGCESTGKIVEIAVDYDQPVSKDQVICRIDPELAEAQHAQSKAELARAKSSLLDAEILQREQSANLPVATKQAKGRLEEVQAALLAETSNWNRIDKLRTSGDASELEWTAIKSNFERAQAAVVIAEAAHEQAKLNEQFLPLRAQQAVDQAKAALQLAEARFEATQAQLDKCIIKSPIDGIVLQRYLDVGTTVNAAFQTPPLFLLAPSLTRMKVNAKVSESDIVHIDVGQHARFTVEGKQRVHFEGRILHKRNQPEIIQGVTTYTVILEVDNDERKTLLPGMSVNVEIECVNRPNATRIANKALRFKPPLPIEERQALVDALEWPAEPTADGGGPALYCKQTHLWQFSEASRQWRAVPVWIGVTDNVNTEILLGAKPGDQFVREFADSSSAGFSLKEALKLASPDNRTL